MRPNIGGSETEDNKAGVGAGNDLVASGRITFPPALLPPRSSDELFVACAGMVLSVLPFLGRERSEADKRIELDGGKFVIPCAESPFER